MSDTARSVEAADPSPARQGFPEPEENAVLALVEAVAAWDALGDLPMSYKDLSTES